jgi:hypothetical protein
MEQCTLKVILQQGCPYNAALSQVRSRSFSPAKFVALSSRLLPCCVDAQQMAGNLTYSNTHSTLLIICTIDKYYTLIINIRKEKTPLVVMTQPA